MKNINEAIKDNLSRIAKEEGKKEHFVKGVEDIALKLIKDIINGNAVTSADIEDSIDKIVSKNTK